MHRGLDLDRIIALTKEERAYMAGFFDGEGHVSMSAVREGQIICTLGISQKRIAILSWFHEVFGGSLFVRVKKEQGDRELGVWSTGDRDTIRMFLRVLRPYLRVKAEELILVSTVLDNPEATSEDARNVMQLVRTIRSQQDRPIAVGE